MKLETPRDLFVHEMSAMRTGEAVIALMFELNRSAGSTLVLVTHDRSVAARCSRILTIEAGHLVGDETVTEL